MVRAWGQLLSYRNSMQESQYKDLIASASSIRLGEQRSQHRGWSRKASVWRPEYKVLSILRTGGMITNLIMNGQSYVVVTVFYICYLSEVWRIIMNTQMNKTHIRLLRNSIIDVQKAFIKHNPPLQSSIVYQKHNILITEPLFKAL